VVVDQLSGAQQDAHRASRAGAAAGDGLLDPVAAFALVVLVLNDHVLKEHAAGTPWAFVTGKLSDVAGVLFLPVLVVACVELVASLARRYRGPSPALAATVAVAVVVAFSLMKTWGPAADAYRVVLGALQWPYFAVVAAASGAPLPGVMPVRHVVDATDLVALPAAAWVVVQARARARSWATRGATNVSNDER
jgi:hypothetical protein